MTENERLARRIGYLAYQASQVVGMGALHARDGATEEEFWSALRGEVNVKAEVFSNVAPMPEANPTGSVYCDYVMGRMMKLSIAWNESGVTTSTSQPRPDYQSWCRKYPTYDALEQAAIASLRDGAAPVATDRWQDNYAQSA